MDDDTLLERANFEKWAALGGWRNFEKIDGGNNYWSKELNLLWRGWQARAALASRAADVPEPAVSIKVSLPDGTEIASWQRDASGRLIADVPERVSEPLTDERISVIMNQHVAAGDRGAEAAMVAAARAVLAAHEASRANSGEPAEVPADGVVLREGDIPHLKDEFDAAERAIKAWGKESRRRWKRYQAALMFARLAAPPADTTPETT